MNRTTRRALYDPMTGGTEPVANVKKAENAAQGAAATASGTAAGYGGAATGIGSTLVPFEQKQLTNPSGMNPTDVNNMLVAGEQGAGGANAGITGQGNLEAARTHNTGALSGVLDQASRNKTQQLSQNALGVQNKNAQVKLGQQDEAAKALGGLYGTDVNAQLKAEGLVPEDINSWVSAGKSGWLQNTLGTIDTLTGAAKAGSQIANA
jgi:hypothetical protein